MASKYTPEELRDASKRVMKSLNWINGKSSKPLAKPAIPNSIGKAEGKISKSSRKRQNKKLRANLAGKKMENLLDVLPDAPQPEPLAQSIEELKQAQMSQANKKSHHSRKAEQQVVNHEIANFGTKSLDEIRANIVKMKSL